MAAPSPHTNRLIQATSPYLLQHAHNPVDWYPWGEEALARARAGQAPLTPELLERAVTQATRGFDPHHGGFGGAPKFPPGMRLELLLNRCREPENPAGTATDNRTPEPPTPNAERRTPNAQRLSMV